MIRVGAVCNCTPPTGVLNTTVNSKRKIPFCFLLSGCKAVCVPVCVYTAPHTRAEAARGPKTCKARDCCEVGLNAQHSNPAYTVKFYRVFCGLCMCCVSKLILMYSLCASTVCVAVLHTCLYAYMTFVICGMYVTSMLHACNFTGRLSLLLLIVLFLCC